MEFSVPQFIDRAPKIVGPLTWRQFLFIGGAGAVIFFLYFLIQQFFLFIIISLLLVGVGGIFAFLKVGGRNAGAVLVNLVGFTISSKLYVWKKKKIPSTVVLKKEIIPVEKEKPDKLSVLKISKKSKLKSLSTQIETRTK